jgi:glutamate synthase (NADPH/NADH) small chain
MTVKREGSLFSPFRALKQLGKKPHTVPIPKVVKPPAERYRGFHTNDLEKCIGCGNCSRVCPDNAIKMVPFPEYARKEPGSMPFRPQIDYGRCCFCALCVEICPTGSLQMVRTFTHVDTGKDSFVFIPDSKVVHETEDFVLDTKGLRRK